MNKYPYVEVSFLIEGVTFDLQQFTKEIGIFPTGIRDIDDWPQNIKNNAAIPEELKPRYVWYICEKFNECNQIEKPINNIISKLAGKEQQINAFCEKNSLQKALSIVIHAKEMEFPEMVLSKQIISYFAKLKAEIGFDVYVY